MSARRRRPAAAGSPNAPHTSPGGFTMTDPTGSDDTGPDPADVAAGAEARETEGIGVPRARGGREAPADRPVPPIAHPPVILPPNPVLGRKLGLRELLIGL